MIVATVRITAPDDVTFDEVHDAYGEWLALLRLRSWDVTGSTADITFAQ